MQHNGQFVFKIKKNVNVNPLSMHLENTFRIIFVKIVFLHTNSDMYMLTKRFITKPQPMVAEHK